jgi:short subunit fatty acids transporter
MTISTSAAPASNHVLFPDHYCWYLLVCVLDLVLTNTMLHHFGGIEVNGIAARIIDSGGFWGLIAFKMATAILVISICEHVGRVRLATARRVAEWAIAISAIPSVLSLTQLGFVAYQNMTA